MTQLAKILLECYCAPIGAPAYYASERSIAPKPTNPAFILFLQIGTSPINYTERMAFARFKLHTALSALVASANLDEPMLLIGHFAGDFFAASKDE